MLHEYKNKTTIKAEQFSSQFKTQTEQRIKYGIKILGPVTSFEGKPSSFALPTKEGDMRINCGDWIATGIDGEHWVIANDIFHRTYERCD